MVLEKLTTIWLRVQQSELGCLRVHVVASETYISIIVSISTYNALLMQSDPAPRMKNRFKGETAV
jgi:hypothetical protein